MGLERGALWPNSFNPPKYRKLTSKTSVLAHPFLTHCNSSQSRVVVVVVGEEYITILQLEGWVGKKDPRKDFTEKGSRPLSSLLFFSNPAR